MPIILIVVLSVLFVVVVASSALVVGFRQRGRPAPPPPRPVTPPPPRPAAPPPRQPTETGPPARAPTVPVIEPEAPAPVAEAPVAEAPVAEPEARPVAPEAPVGEPAALPVAEPEVVAEPEALPVAEPEVVARPSFRDRLGRARSLFAGYLGSVRERDRIDASTWDELEEALILADVGVEVTGRVLDDLRGQVKQEGITTPDALIDALKAQLVATLDGARDLHLTPGATNVWLFVGVNGVGKTTTIGKLGLRQRDAGHQVVMAAGDTFRAAAADQLALWADRVGVDLVRGNEGGDPGAVVFDAVQHAAARGCDLVLADTAGRLHTKVNLMEELKKVHRVAGRPPGEVSEVLLVIDATTGQNGLVQARQFADAVGVTGVVLTKLDGTAKGGIAVAIRAELGIPIKLVGLGEAVGDLVEFDPIEFVDALMAET